MKKKTSSHIYDYQIRPGSVGSIVPRMIEAGAKVLELGTGPGAITKELHAKGCRVTGLEIDATAIPLAAPYCERIIQCDLNAPDWAAAVDDERFDAIVMTDVLEHLYDPWTTLATTVSLLRQGGCVVVSLPHVAHSAIVASLLNERFDYQPVGLLDRTHIRFFGLHNIKALFDGAGLKIVDVDFVVKLPEQTEFASQWKRLPKATQQALRGNPHGNVYQTVIKAVASSASGREVDLFTATMPDPAPGHFVGNGLTRYLAGFFSFDNRQRIAKGLRWLGFRL